MSQVIVSRAICVLSLTLDDDNTNSVSEIKRNVLSR